MSDDSAIIIDDAMPAEIPSSPEVGQSEDGQPSSDGSGLSVVMIEETVTSTPPTSSRQVAGSVGSLGSPVMHVDAMHDSSVGPADALPDSIARSMLRVSGLGRAEAGTMGAIGTGASRAAAEDTQGPRPEVSEVA